MLFSDTQMVLEFLVMIFPEDSDAPSSNWDEHFEYKCSEMEVYFQVYRPPFPALGHAYLRHASSTRVVSGHDPHLMRRSTARWHSAIPRSG